MYEDIPDQEYQKFQSFIQVYQKGAVIVKENEIDDKGIFLLRKGSVSVYKGQGNKREQISKIDAINFFGDMSIIAGGARSASVEALQDNTIVYAFRTPDLDVLLSNPTWGRMLVSRLAHDLKQSNIVVMEQHERLNNLEMEKINLTNGVIEVLNITYAIQNKIANDAVATAREWKYLIGIVDLVQRLVNTRLPGVAQRLGHVDVEIWKRLYEEGICPEIIYRQMSDVEEIE
jgi:CRP-like cAMP-binding protein